MVTLFTPSGPIYHLGSLFLLLSVFCGNILLLRTLLFLGFLCLGIWAALGLPSWPSVFNPGFFALDGFIWSLLNMIMQFGLIVRISSQYLAEFHRSFRSPKEEMLWRGLHRHGGMSYIDFKQLMDLGEWESFSHGTVIQDGKKEAEYFSFILTGLVEAYTLGKVNPIQLAGLDAFDFSLADQIGVPLGMHAPLFVRALRQTTTFRIHQSKFGEILKSETLVSSLRHIIFYGLAMSVRRKHGVAISQAEIDSHPDTQPLDPALEPQSSLLRFFKDGIVNPFAFRVRFNYTALRSSVMPPHVYSQQKSKSRPPRGSNRVSPEAAPPEAHVVHLENGMRTSPPPTDTHDENYRSQAKDATKENSEWVL